MSPTLFSNSITLTTTHETKQLFNFQAFPVPDRHLWSRVHLEHSDWPDGARATGVTRSPPPPPCRQSSLVCGDRLGLERNRAEHRHNSDTSPTLHTGDIGHSRHRKQVNITAKRQPVSCPLRLFCLLSDFSSPWSCLSKRFPDLPASSFAIQLILAVKTTGERNLLASQKAQLCSPWRSTIVPADAVFCVFKAT